MSPELLMPIASVIEAPGTSMLANFRFLSVCIAGASARIVTGLIGAKRLIRTETPTDRAG